MAEYLAAVLWTDRPQMKLASKLAAFTRERYLVPFKAILRLLYNPDFGTWYLYSGKH